MNIVFYQSYIGQPAEQLKKIHFHAARESPLCIGIDTNFYPVCTYQKDRTSYQQLKFCFDYLVSYFKWYLLQISEKRLIIPLGLAVCFVDWVWPFPPSLPFREMTMSAFYKNNPSLINSEIMATYIRHISYLSEEFGMSKFTPWIIKRFFFRFRIYAFCLKVLFKIKPRMYVTWQGGYLQFFLPCLTSVKQNIPVAYLGSADGAPLRIENQYVWRDCEWPVNSVPINKTSSYLRNQNRVRKEAENIIQQRIAGNKIDPLIYYMTENPYTQKSSSDLTLPYSLSSGNFNILYPDRRIFPKGFVVVYMHEFNDYHHNGVLPSFVSSYYEWLLVTCKILATNKVPYVVKVHPQMLISSEREIFQRSLRSFALMSTQFSAPIPIVTSMTSTQLIAQGMSVGCTVRGTIATELIFQRSPVICAGNPPYMNFIPARMFNSYSDYSNALIRYNSHDSITDDEYRSNLDYLSRSLKVTNTSFA